MREAAFADYLIGERLGPRTRSTYLRWTRDANEWLARQGSTLATASATQVAAYAEAMIPNSHSSRGQAAAAFKHYWTHIDRDRPPIRAIRVPPAPEMVCRAIEEDQARSLVKAAFGWYPHGTIVLTGMYLALRRFEIAKMEWSRFSDELDWYRVTGKYDKTATLPVHPHLRAEFATYRTDSRWVFPGRFPDRHITPNTVWMYTLEVGRSVGIENLKPHELRHTSLATANDKTGNLRAVQTFARHSKPGTTSGYTRTTASKLREVSDSLDYLS